jgi:thiaminase
VTIADYPIFTLWFSYSERFLIIWLSNILVLMVLDEVHTVIKNEGAVVAMIYGSWINNYQSNQCLSPLLLRV